MWYGNDCKRLLCWVYQYFFHNFAIEMHESTNIVNIVYAITELPAQYLTFHCKITFKEMTNLLNMFSSSRFVSVGVISMSLVLILALVGWPAVSSQFFLSLSRSHELYIYMYYPLLSCSLGLLGQIFPTEDFSVMSLICLQVFTRWSTAVPSLSQATQRSAHCARGRRADPCWQCSNAWPWFFCKSSMAHGPQPAATFFPSAIQHAHDRFLAQNKAEN